MPNSKKSVVISGYYGFDNLGDEAILEQLCSEIGQIDSDIHIIVLSQNPASTSKKYDVESISRWNVLEIYNALSKADLFISGGGGLFQDSSSIKSVIYYAFLFFLARLKRVPIFVYAQGIGPLRSSLSRFLTQASMTLASCISVRDQKSASMLENWNLDYQLTADPVWALNQNCKTTDTTNGAKTEMKVGLSLRQCDVLDQSFIEVITQELQKVLPQKSILVPLILQENLDKEVIENVTGQLNNFSIEPANLNHEDLPSYWMAKIASLDIVIAMRLHACIMALKSGVATLLLSYDPKVSTVAKEFKQPYLDMTKQNSKNQFHNCLLELLENKNELVQIARAKAFDKEKEARQNKELLAKFLK